MLHVLCNKASSLLRSDTPNKYILTLPEEKLNNQADKTWKNLAKVIEGTVKEEIGHRKPKTKKISM